MKATFPNGEWEMGVVQIKNCETSEKYFSQNTKTICLGQVSSKYIKSRVEESGSQKVGIRSHTGGHPVTINVGKQD